MNDEGGSIGKFKSDGHGKDVKWVEAIKPRSNGAKAFAIYGLNTTQQYVPVGYCRS
jgi:hypothetical protein